MLIFAAPMNAPDERKENFMSSQAGGEEDFRGQATR